jgi:netrin-G3 ligand
MVLDMPHGSVLRIEPVKANRDDTSFDCVADNGIGEPAIASATLEVYPDLTGLPTGYPRITESPTLKAVEKDRNTVMLCAAIGNPDPVITWLKDYIPLDTSDPRLRILETGSLQIRHSQESDEGKYECVAENRKGVAYSYGANLYVRVRRVPPHFSIPPENVEVMPGDDVNITCSAVGSPMPYVKWRLGDVELTPEDDIPIGRNILMLTDVRQTANYTCVAASELDNIEAVAQVKVKSLPKPPSRLTLSEVTATSVKLSWQPSTPSSSTSDQQQHVVESYIIQYKRKYTPGTTYIEIADITGMEYTVRGLTAYTVYEFRVVAVNNNAVRQVAPR